jgi:tetratricopeptide (TPR) repeat protein
LQKVDPESELLQFDLVLCAILSGDFDRASIMVDVMSFPGKTPAYYFARGVLALKRGNRASAEKYFESAKKYYPENQCAYFSRCRQELDVADNKISDSGGGEGGDRQKLDR